MLRVRFRCTIRAEQIEDGDLKNAADAIEVEDWQTLAPDGKSWMPWTFGSITMGYYPGTKVAH